MPIIVPERQPSQFNFTLLLSFPCGFHPEGCLPDCTLSHTASSRFFPSAVKIKENVRGELQTSVKVKRAYEQAAEADGTRILVERLWPRGVTKQALRIDKWAKDASPSAALRRWFGHDPARWEEFRRRYRAELDEHPEAVAPLLDAARGRTLTLVYGARDTVHNSAVALKEYLEEHARGGRITRSRGHGA